MFGFQGTISFEVSAYQKMFVEVMYLVPLFHRGIKNIFIGVMPLVDGRSKGCGTSDTTFLSWHNFIYSFFIWTEINKHFSRFNLNFFHLKMKWNDMIEWQLKKLSGEVKERDQQMIWFRESDYWNWNSSNIYSEENLWIKISWNSNYQDVNVHSRLHNKRFDIWIK